MHPAKQADDALTPDGHRAYCAKLIKDAVEGAAGVSQQSADMKVGLKKNKKIPWTLRGMAIRRNARADRKVIGAYQDLAKACLNKAKVRESVDAEINESEKARPSAREYRTR